MGARVRIEPTFDDASIGIMNKVVAIFMLEDLLFTFLSCLSLDCVPTDKRELRNILLAVN